MSATHLHHLAQLIGNDSHAATFQSLDQYRQALLKEITQASAAPEQEPAAWMDSRSPGMHATISNEVKRHNTRLGGAATAAVTGYSIPLYTHPSAEIDRLQAEIKRLESAWHVDAMRRKDDLIAAQERENDRVKKELAEAQAENAKLRAALKFYADSEHYHFESDNWDSVSGEPSNILWHSDEPDYIEDGEVARAALSAIAQQGDQP